MPRKVAVETRGFTFRGCSPEQIKAADRFARDYEAVFGGAGRGAPVEPKVGGGRPAGGGSPGRIDAAQRLEDLQRELGERAFFILKVSVIHGFGPAAIHNSGGPPIAVVSYEIKRALDQTGSFYGRKKPPKDRMLDAMNKLVSRAARGA